MVILSENSVIAMQCNAILMKGTSLVRIDPCLSLCYTLPLARPAQAKIQMLTAVCIIVKSIH